MMLAKDLANQKVCENKFAKLWARRVERLEKVFRQKFRYTPFIFEAECHRPALPAFFRSKMKTN